MKKTTQRKVQPKSSFDTIHVDLTGLTGQQIQMRVDRHKYFVATCARVGCDHSYAYSGGKNPQYCPKCLKFILVRFKICSNYRAGFVRRADEICGKSE